MPQKTTEDGQKYRIDGKTLIWTTEDGDTVKIPMRIKLKIVRAMAGEDTENTETMFKMIDQIAPGQVEVMDEMDVNDFAAMFKAWNSEYTALSGASLGE